MTRDRTHVLVDREAEETSPTLRKLLGPWLRADFRRNSSLESRVTVSIWRIGNAAHVDAGPLGMACRLVHRSLDLPWTRAAIGAELPGSVIPGPGVGLQHAGRGVVLNPTVRLGSNVTIFHRVTLGTRGGTAAPYVGDRVRFGVDCCVLGGVIIGTDVKIGAKALVTRDVPDGSTVRAPLAVASRTLDK